MTDTEQIYNILLAKNYQEELFSMPTKRKEKGGRELVKDCPFCGKEAHFYVSTEKPFYHCFACNASGDWIKYLKETRGYDFREALSTLAERAGVKVEGFDEKRYKERQRRASLIEEANSLFIASLSDERGKEVSKYLKDNRGYSKAEIEAMELGAYTDREGLKRYLKEKGYTDEELQSSGLFTAGLGITHTLTVLWRDASGKALGISGRTLLSDEEREKKGLQKYVNAAGLEKNKGFIGLERIRSKQSKDALLVEGVLDALLIASRGFPVPAIALGGLTISSYQQKALEDAGVTDLVVALDNDEPGQRATEKLIESLYNSRVRLYVMKLPPDIKDIDELLRKGRSFEETKTVSWSKWLPGRLFSKYDLDSDIGYRKALDESLRYLAKIESPLERKEFTEALIDLSDLNSDAIEEEAARLREGYREEQAEKELQRLRSKLDGILQAHDITGAELELQSTLEALQKKRGLEIPEPYLLSDYLRDLKETPPSLETGFKELDKLVRIPQGAISIIAGRPRHGKTTLMINMMLRMIEKYPDRRFYFYSYELPKNKLATMMLMSMAKALIEVKGKPNFDCYEEYIKSPPDEKIKPVEEAIKKYEELTSSGRLYVIDRPLNENDLKRLIMATSERKDTGAVFIDYLQKIPLEGSASQRYVEIKQASEALRQAAVACNIPIIAGAQLGRSSAPILSTGKSKKLDNKPKEIELKRPRLENLRESGDIEQDASLVLAIFNEEAEKQDSSGAKGVYTGKNDTIELIVLKNRLGKSNDTCFLKFNGSIFSITDADIRD
jgi:DNA primase catalytic core